MMVVGVLVLCVGLTLIPPKIRGGLSDGQNLRIALFKHTDEQSPLSRRAGGLGCIP